MMKRVWSISAVLKLVSLLAGALALAPQAARAQSLTVSSVAGVPSTFSETAKDGTGTSARLGWVPAMVTDASGNVYFIDGASLRRMTPAGVVTTVAGVPGTSGYVDATGAAARFREPRSLNRDRAGNFYVGDANRIRKVTPAGVVTTLVAQLNFAGSAAASATAGNAINGDPVWGFSGVQSFAFDAAGTTLYVGDYTAIRRIFATGLEAAFVGMPYEQGKIDGVGAAARFSGLLPGMVFDAAGNLYVADMMNHAIRKVTPAGVVTTLAGSLGVSGYADGAGSAARFDAPQGLAIDASGNLFVADLNNAALRKITLAGVVSTVAGGVKDPAGPPSMDGVGSQARFAGITAVTVDAQGTVYLVDGTTIKKAVNVAAAAKVVVPPQSISTPAGQSVTFRVTANGSPPPSYQWQRQPSGQTGWTALTEVAPFSGTATAALQITGVSLAMGGDQYRCVVTNVSGSDASAAATLAVDPPVVIVPLRVSTLAGRAGVNAGADDGLGSAARFTGPMAAATDAAGNIYVADSFGSRVRKVTPAGAVTTLAGTGKMGGTDGAGTIAQFGQPAGLATDSAGNVYVADGWNGNIRKITPAGVVSTLAGKVGDHQYANGPGAQARFVTPLALAFDKAGNLIVGDTIWLRKIAPDGMVSGIDFHFPVAGDDAPLTDVAGLVLDAADNVYVAAGTAVRKVTPAGQVTTVAGRANTAGNVDGRAVNARFGFLRGIARDSVGNLYVADTGNHTIRKISPDGFVTTVAGVAPSVSDSNPTGSADGIGATVRFNQPSGLAFDRLGNLYITDALNHTLRKASSVDVVSVGSSIALSVYGAGEAASYQWRKNSVPIPGATGGSLSIAAASVDDAANYTVEVRTAGGGAVESAPVGVSVGDVAPPVIKPPVVEPPVVTPPVVEPPVVTPPVVTPPVVVPPPEPVSRIANLSIRSQAGQGAAVLSVGFVSDGRVPLLIRGVGPTLAGFGVGAAVTDPRLSVFAGTTLNASNDNWSPTVEMRDAVTRLGAFALQDGSLDAALLTTLEAGAYTAQCGAASTGGIALVELYDASTAAATAGRLINVSARSQVGVGEGILIAGFSIQGTKNKTLLIRGIGPTLASFGVAGALADPQLKVLDSAGAAKAQNDNWSDNGAGAALALMMQGAGAFGLPEGSRDSALVVTLPPGTYTAQLSGAAAGTGIGLIEIYELP